MRLNWPAKIEHPWSPILLISYTVVSEKCQKETETEETIGFFATFLSSVKFQSGGAPAPLLLPTPMLQVRKTKKVFANFPRGFWRFPTKFQPFKKYCCPRAEDKAIFEDLRLRGQGQ